MSEHTRLQIGKAALAQVDGSAADSVMHSLETIAPDVGKYILEFAFGDIYTRPVLDLKQREMITITSLLIQGDTAPQLDVHINGALNVGLTQEEIIETFIQCIPYIGFPKVLNAISTAKSVFVNRTA
ncbi:carboxymuconolactone decarboxylase family protein [Secundilactobacillus kimchicus]|uniref:carboxymuconolactone decarboxylase family protein n=1 Tax=Secundilactobacillus kimchicus TaxID=528209 RepID=UPI0024A99371|nr:carboxymuconolactone decarboxylase family protein [Secundilactobacillus kimchicus]